MRRIRLPRAPRRLAAGPGLTAQPGRGPLSRRTVLRGLLSGSTVALALPWLEIFAGRDAWGCGGAIPRRFGLYFWGNGNLPDYWTPTGEGEDWSLSEQLAPLQGLEAWISVISGLSVKLPNTVPHTSGAAGILSGGPLESVGEDETFALPTIDQVIAAEIGGETLYRSVQTAATDTLGLSYTGPSSREPAETDPYAFYERIFGETFRVPGEEGVIDPTLALRRSILDAVGDDLRALKRRVGRADRQRLEQHLDGVRDLERRLARLEEDPPNLEACARPDAPEATYPDEEGRPQIAARNRAMCDLIAMALACDQTRVFAHYLTEPVNNVLFPGASEGHHTLTHDEPGEQPEVNAITIQCIEGYAALLSALAAIPEEDGCLLDNCAVLACSEVSHGRLHALDDMPLLVAGSCCGALKTGIHYRSYSQENASTLLLSLVRAMDIPAATFGADEGEVDEGLSEIEP